MLELRLIWNPWGVPGMLLPLVILLEAGGGLALVVGWQTRWTAFGLAGFSVLAALIFHNNLGDQMQMIMFMKNMAIAGGLLLLAEHGAGEFSFEKKFTVKQKKQIDEIYDELVNQG